MNEFTKDRSTAEQLVEKLDNELEMTICSDVVHGLDYEYKQLQQENQELNKQLENCYCNRTDCSARIKDSKQYDSLVQKIENQQKEFVEWLEKEISSLEKDSQIDCINNMLLVDIERDKRLYQKVLSKYKEITGDKE